MKTKTAVVTAMVATALALVGCASPVDDDEHPPTTGNDDARPTAEQGTSETQSIAMRAAPGGSHDGRCTGGEILAGCGQQACTHGTGLPNPQCPLGYYCWCW